MLLSRCMKEQMLQRNNKGQIILFVCAWCGLGKEFDKKYLQNKLAISHGICDTCYSKVSKLITPEGIADLMPTNKTDGE